MSHNPDKHGRIISELTKYSSAFIQLHATPQSLITVTRVELSEDARYATIFISVLPEKEEEKALAFLNRHLRDLQHYIREHVRAHTPFISIMADIGERNRQRVDQLIHEVENGTN